MTAKEQREAFIRTAREVEADESGEAFERAFERVASPTQANGPHKVEDNQRNDD